MTSHARALTGARLLALIGLIGALVPMAVLAPPAGAADSGHLAAAGQGRIAATEIQGVNPASTSARLPARTPTTKRDKRKLVSAIRARADEAQTLTAGGEHGCIIKAGALYCWGRNSWGQIGAGAYGSQMPTELRVGSGSLWKSVDGGGATTCAIRTNGKLFCWGVNNKGQVGIPATDPRKRPAAVVTPRRWTQVSAGWFTTCAVDTQSKAWCWGDNAGAQFGKTSPKTSSAPVRVPGTGWKSVSTGMSRFVCGVKTDGSLWCWGGNLFGQLGVGDQPNQTRPTRVGTAAGWVKVSTSWTHTCALNTSGQVWCWGRNTLGQLGTTPSPVSSTPVLASGTTPALDVATTEGASCLLGTDGRARCWGNNAYGIVGDPSIPYTPTPTLVGPEGLQRLDGGWRHMCGLTASGAQTCWGENDRAQLGNGTTTSSPSGTETLPPPTAVPGGPTPLRLATINALGNSHTRPYAQDDHYAPTTTRSGWLADDLMVNNIDVAGLQEMGSDQLTHLLKSARGTYASYPGPEAGDLGVESTIVWRKDVWDLVEATTITTQFISRSLPRPIVKLRHRTTGQEIWVMNVHNAPWDYQRKRDMATDLQIPKLAELRATGLPVFYVGDFNEWRTVLCKTLAGTDLVSPYGGSYDPATGVCTNPPGRMRVDWIFGPPTATYTGFTYFRDALLSLVTDHNGGMVDVSMPAPVPARKH